MLIEIPQGRGKWKSPAELKHYERTMNFRLFKCFLMRNVCLISFNFAREKEARLQALNGTKLDGLLDSKGML